MNKIYKDFIEFLLTAKDVPRPEEPNVGKIEEIDPEKFNYISSIIKICQSITDDQISNYVKYVNNAMENSGEFEKFISMASEMRTTEQNEEFI